MQPRVLMQRQILLQLENLISKLKSQSPEFSDVDCSVLPGYAGGSFYIIEISQGRFNRRVTVDLRMIEHLQSAQFDSNLSQEIRNAMRTVARWASERT
jgi:hypothetical protein